MKCPKCNTNNSNGSKYCVSCQTPLPKKIRSSPKECPKCGAVYKSSLDSSFCTKCQCELVERKKSKKIVILVVSAIIVLILGLAAISAFFIYPVIAFNSAVESGDTSKLVSVFRSHPNILDSDERMGKYINLMEKRAEAYLNEDIEYEKADSDFENFGIIDSHLSNQNSSEVYQEQHKRVDRIHESRMAYLEADTSLAAKVYRDAEAKYSSVIEEDSKYYTLAQAKLVEIKETKDSYLQKADSLKTTREYEQCISTLTDGLTDFGYDSEYENKYTEAIISCVGEECNGLMQQGRYFSDKSSQGAFNIAYSYVNQERYSECDSLKTILNEIVEKSEADEVASASESLGLVNRSYVLDLCSIQAAKDYIADASIQNDNSYILSLCRENGDIQTLVNVIPAEKQLNVALITNVAMTADDFSKVSKEKVESYAAYQWDYTGIGRYYDEEKCCFGWATIIIYEME